MAKSITTVSIDSEALSLARSRDINLSGVLTELLKQYLEMDEMDISDIAKIQTEVSEKEAEVHALKAHLSILKKQKESEDAKKPKELSESELSSRRWYFK